MSEFKPGEIAVFVVNPGESVIHPLCCGLINHGDLVTLIEFDPIFKNWRIDRLDRNGRNMVVYEKNLRKRRPPEQPADEDFQRDLNRWLKRDREVVV